MEFPSMNQTTTRTPVYAVAESTRPADELVQLAGQLADLQARRELLSQDLAEMEKVSIELGMRMRKLFQSERQGDARLDLILQAVLAMQEDAPRLDTRR